MVECQIEQSNFMDLIFGHYEKDCVYSINKKIIEDIGKERIVKEVCLQGSYNYYDDKGKEKLLKDIELDTPEGWELFSDGIGTQQPFEQHIFNICRYADQDEKEKE